MKLLHVSDLHIGKKVNGFSMLEDVVHVLNRIVEVGKDLKADGLIIAGDIYDNSIPPVEAVRVFDEFISELHEAKIPLFIVSGNHDNISRVSFGANIMANEKVYIAPKYSGEVTSVLIGKNVRIWLLPFIRPLNVREFYPDFELGSYNDMVRVVTENLEVDKNEVNILVAHQFVTCGATGPERSESESSFLGTLENVDVSNFDKFDYVALGHIHKPQIMGRKNVRYSGAPIKYSFSEKNDKKSMVLLNIDEKKKSIKTELITFEPLHDMKEFVGNFEDLVKLVRCEDYVRIVLKDEEFIPDVKHKLEVKFPNIMEIVYDNRYTRENNEGEFVKNLKEKSPLMVFKEFYEMRNNSPMSEDKVKIVEGIMEEILSENSCK